MPKVAIMAINNQAILYLMELVTRYRVNLLVKKKFNVVHIVDNMDLLAWF